MAAVVEEAEMVEEPEGPQITNLPSLPFASKVSQCCKLAFYMFVNTNKQNLFFSYWKYMVVVEYTSLGVTGS